MRKPASPSTSSSPKRGNPRSQAPSVTRAMRGRVPLGSPLIPLIRDVLSDSRRGKRRAQRARARARSCGRPCRTHAGGYRRLDSSNSANVFSTSYGSSTKRLGVPFALGDGEKVASVHVNRPGRALRASRLVGGLLRFCYVVGRLRSRSGVGPAGGMRREDPAGPRSDRSTLALPRHPRARSRECASPPDCSSRDRGQDLRPHRQEARPRRSLAQSPPRTAPTGVRPELRRLVVGRLG